MNIALFPNTQKKNACDIARSIRNFLTNHHVDVFAEDDIAESIAARPLSSIDPKTVNFIVSIGGDGTILRLMHRHPELEAPILAINLGSFGFMADIPLDAIFPSLENLLSGNFIIQNRMMMEGQNGTNGVSYAVNEVAIHRAKNPCLIDLALYVDGVYLNTFSADGMIIATPSGSTAYSLAAGGPILTPELRAFVLTPICPHTISNRPVVLMPKHEIRIEYLSAHEPVEIIYDGFPCFEMAKNETLEIRCSNRIFKLISMPDHDFFFTLRTKLGWAGKLRA